jgi:threonine dehydratase
MEVRAAGALLRGIVQRTPLVPLHSFSQGNEILLKLEIHQPVTSFKIRGVFYAVASLDEIERQRGISTVSAGNTAQALAWAGRYYGVSARSVMPESAPQSKIDAVRAYGGTPVLVPTAEVFRFLRERCWEQEPYAFIHPWINRDVMIGHATLALEIIEDCPDVDTVFVPVGGGGLIAGVGSALKALRPGVKIVAVEPAGCASLDASLRTGSPASVECHTICDGVAVPYITDELFPLLREVSDECILVSDSDVKRMIRRLAVGNKVIAEPSAALAPAAALSIPEAGRGRTVALVTGGNIDPEKLLAILRE